MIMSALKNDMPKHLAIIMDGNGRWARHYIVYAEKTNA